MTKPTSTVRGGAHLRANGIRQHYLRFGEGTPLLIVPGITSPAATWAFVGEALGALFDVHVLDVRGRGLSSSGPTLDYGLDACAADITAFARARGWQDGAWHLLGHSMGARIAARAVSRHGARPARVVLADPPVSGPGRRPYVKPLAFYTDAILEAASGAIDTDAMRRTYPNWTPAQHAARAEWLHTCEPEAIAQTLRSFNEDDIHADLPRLQMPALLMVAGKGDVIRAEELAEIRQIAPGLQVAELAHVGHMIPFDDLDGFCGVVRPFLAK